jgi:plastocyanin
MKNIVRSTGITALFLLLIVGAGCKNDSSNPYGAPTSPGPSTPSTPAGVSANTVVMSGSAFNPVNITVTVGTTVTWKNNDGYAHTATASDGSWNTGNIAGGASASHTFTTAGTYPYVCTYHAAMGMTGTVTVK